MRAGAEGQRLGPAAVGGDVELRRRAVAVGGVRAREDERALGEDDVAELDLLARDPRGERRDRREAQDLLDRRPPRGLRRVGRARRHWSGCSAKSSSACASCDCVVSTPPTSTELTTWTHSSSVSRSPSSSAARRVERRSSAPAASLRDSISSARVRLELRRRPLERGQLVAQLDRVELALDRVRPRPQPLGVLERRAHDASRSSARGTASRAPRRRRSARRRRRPRAARRSARASPGAARRRRPA